MRPKKQKSKHCIICGDHFTYTGKTRLYCKYCRAELVDDILQKAKMLLPVFLLLFLLLPTHCTANEQIATTEQPQETRIIYQGISEKDLYNIVFNVMLWLEEPNPRDYTALIMTVGKAESNLKHLRQIKGVARSLFQIEPDTHKCVYDNYLNYRPKLKEKVLSLKADAEVQGLENLTYNLGYSIAIAYCCLKRYIPIPPDKDDKLAQATLHKQYYNTHLGKAIIAETLAKL